MPGKVDFSLFDNARTVDEMFAAYLTAKLKLTPEYTASGLSDVGNTIAYVLMAIADNLHLRYDMEAAQLIPERTVRPESLKGMLRLIGSDIEPPTAATADLLLTFVGTPPSDDTIVPAFTTFQATGPGVTFSTVSDVTIPANTGSFTVQVMHGTLDGEQLGTSSGLANQVFFSTLTDIVSNSAQNTLNLFVGDELWIQVRSFANSVGTDPHFIYRRLADGSGAFIFGDGAYGRIPESDAVISIRCLVGGGQAGNVGAGAIDSVASNLYTSSGAPVTLTVTNALEASGGRDEMSVSEARVLLPGKVRAQDRALTLRDHESIAKGVGGVASARSKRTGLTTVTTYVLASGSQTGAPSQLLLNNVKSILEDSAIATDDIVTAAPTFVPINLAIQIRVRRGYDQYAALSNANSTVASLFSIQDRIANGLEVFGSSSGSDGSIYFSDVAAAIDSTLGVDSVEIITMHRSPQVQLKQWSGAATFDVKPTVGKGSVDELITVRFIAATKYIVVGSESGSIGLGIVGYVFSDTSDRLTFKISNSGSAMQEGDYAEFRVSRYAGTVKVYDEEVAILGDYTSTVLVS